jgi:hypothetical protein
MARSHDRKLKINPSRRASPRAPGWIGRTRAGRAAWAEFEAELDKYLEEWAAGIREHVRQLERRGSARPRLWP